MSRPKVVLGRPVGRPVVVREIEMRDTEVEGTAHDRATALERVDPAEVVPEAERDRGQHEPAAAAPVVPHPVVAVLRSHVGRHRHLHLGCRTSCRRIAGWSAGPSAAAASRSRESSSAAGTSAGSARRPPSSDRAPRGRRRSACSTPHGTAGSRPSTRPTPTAAAAASRSSVNGSRRRARASGTGS